MNKVERIQAIQSKLVTLNELTAKLDREIKEPKANDYFLGTVRQDLHDVETLFLPWASEASTRTHASLFLDAAEFELSQSAGRLIYAQEMLAKYGEGIQIIGG